MQTIAILGGTGEVGSGLALRWANAGHQVFVGSRVCDRARAHVHELLRNREHLPIQAGSNRDAAKAGDLIVMAVPYSAQRATADDVRDLLEGKIILDTTVPLAPTKAGRVHLPTGGSAVAELQTFLGKNVSVVSALQNVAAAKLAVLDAEIECDVLVCGDNDGARSTVILLLADIGIRGIDAGPIINSTASEALTSVLIAINGRYKIRGAGIRITGLPNAYQYDS